MSDMKRTITPNDPADFTPTREPQIPLQPFRYWCQKVLPLVYDDSLSYYDLLCKVVDYLNKTMEDVTNLNTDIENLYTAYTELQNYVNNYFSSLDVQEEINNKLDKMAIDGTLYNIIKKYTDPIVNEQNKKISVLESRMDAFASLPDGSTAGDAELLDIRVDFRGKTWESAGESVRKATGEIFSDTRDKIDNLNNLTGSVYFLINKGLNSAGDYFDAKNRLITPILSPSIGDYIETTNEYEFRVYSYIDGVIAIVQDFNTYYEHNINNQIIIMFRNKTNPESNITENEIRNKIFGNIITPICVKGEATINHILTKTPVTNQTINQYGNIADLSNRLLSAIINVIYYPQKIISNEGYSFRVALFDDEENFLNITDWSTDYTIESPQNIRICVRNDNGSPLNISDFEKALFSNVVEFNSYLKYKTIENTDENFMKRHSDICNLMWVDFWNYPKIVENNGNGRKTISFGYVNTAGVSGCSTINTETNSSQSVDLFTSEVDDHDDCCVFINPFSNKYMVFGFKHNKEKNMKIFISKAEYDSIFYNEPIIVQMPGNVTYCQCFADVENEKIVIFTRINTNSWYMCRSTDKYGTEWEEPKKVVYSDKQYYCAIRKTTSNNLLRIVMYSNPHFEPRSDTRIRMGFINIETGAIYDSDNSTILGNIGDGVKDISFNIIINIDNYNESASSDVYGEPKLRLYDVCDSTDPLNPYVTFSKFNAGDRGSGEYYVLYNNHEIKICPCGYALYEQGDLSEGISFVGNNTDKIILGRYTSAEGNNGYSVLELYTKNGDHYEKNKEIDRSFNTNPINRIIRPKTNINGNICVYLKGVILTGEYYYSFDALVKEIP